MVHNFKIKQHQDLKSFASPDFLDQDFENFLKDASSLLCNWISKAGTSNPLPNISKFPDIEPKANGLTREELLKDLFSVMEGAYQPSHPGSLAHLDPPPNTASVAADLICAGLNNNLLADELSPTLSYLERKLCKWLACRMGMPQNSGGIAASGGTISNLMALVLARHSSGLEFDPKAVFLISEDAHVSFIKALRVMGLPSSALQKVSTNKFGQLSTNSLIENYYQLKTEGKKCFAVIGTAGTTVRGAIDPLKEISDFCLDNHLWFHIDAAIGGTFALSDNTSSIFEGISLADSITLNPQKLLGIAKTSSVLLVADKSKLLSTFSTGLPYIDPSIEDDGHLGEMGLQGSRPGEVLKLWLGLRQLGEYGIKDIIDNAIQRRLYFQNIIDPSLFNIISGPLHLISFSPLNFDINQSEKWSRETRNMLLNKDFMLSRPLYHGIHYLKSVMGNPHTKLYHLDKLAYLINTSLSD